MEADSMQERLLIGPGSPPSPDPVHPELSPPPEPCLNLDFPRGWTGGSTTQPPFLVSITRDSSDECWISRTDREWAALRRRLTGVAGLWNLELTCENLAWLAVALAILRVWEYLEFRSLYMDESALANVADLTSFRPGSRGDQMAPPGFLVIERLLVHLPLDVKVTGRLFPLFCGIASVFLMRMPRATSTAYRSPWDFWPWETTVIGRDQAILLRQSDHAGCLWLSPPPREPSGRHFKALATSRCRRANTSSAAWHVPDSGTRAGLGFLYSV